MHFLKNGISSPICRFRCSHFQLSSVINILAYLLRLCMFCYMNFLTFMCSFPQPEYAWNLSFERMLHLITIPLDHTWSQLNDHNVIFQYTPGDSGQPGQSAGALVRTLLGSSAGTEHVICIGTAVCSLAWTLHCVFTIQDKSLQVKAVQLKALIMRQVHAMHNAQVRFSLLFACFFWRDIKMFLFCNCCYFCNCRFLLLLKVIALFRRSDHKTPWPNRSTSKDHLPN